MKDYMTVVGTVLTWGFYAMFVYHVAAAFGRRKRQGREQPRMLGLWLTLWVLFSVGVLAYCSMYPVGMAVMAWMVVNVGLMLPALDERENDASLASRKLAGAAISMTLLSALILAVGWPLTVLRPEWELYRFITVLIACIASVIFVRAIGAAWRRWRSGRAQSC